MTMNKIVPIEEIRSVLQIDFEVDEYGIDDIDKIIELCSLDVFGIGGYVWSHLVEEFDVDPQKFELAFTFNDPKLYQLISDEVGIEVLNNIGVSIYTLGDDAHIQNTFCKVVVSQVYGNKLLISDVLFTDPSRPVEAEDKKYDLHEYRGLGVFNSFLERTKKYCRLNAIDSIALLAATEEQVGFFENYGFEVETTEYARIAVANGFSIPMVIELSN